MSYQEIVLDQPDQHIYRITLNRPEKLNALTPTLEVEVVDACRTIDEDPEARVLVLTGAGRAFCAGADVGGMKDGAAFRDGDRPSPERGRQNLRRTGGAMMLALYQLEIPTIAMVNGPAVGGGFDLVCTTDLAVASSNARFQVAYVKRGLFPDLGGFWTIPRVLGERKAMELIYTGRFVSAPELLEAGGLNAVWEPEELADRTLDLAREIAASTPLGNKMSKMLMRTTLRGDFRSALEVSAASVSIVGQSEDHREAVQAFFEKRDPVFKGR